MFNSVLIIGAGAYGNALKACILPRNNLSVTLFSKQDCENFSGSIYDFNVIILAVPSQSLRNCAQWLYQQLKKNLHLQRKINIVSTAKGIERKSVLLPHQILEDVFGEFKKTLSISVLSGPSFAKEMVLGLPTCVVLASNDKLLLKNVTSLLHSPKFRIYDSEDVLGVEIGGALKNVIAMVAGAVDGMNLGNNARAAVITRGLSEMAKIGIKMGANPITFMGLSGVGDLILTCTGDLSRNRQFGYRIAQGEDLNTVLQSLGGVVEGFATAESAYSLAKNLNVKTSIIQVAYQVLYENLPISDALQALITGEQSTEFNWPSIGK
jgi:glycerol-3-phosphate dehydrogenase (NAD(P)+)